LTNRENIFFSKSLQKLKKGSYLCSPLLKNEVEQQNNSSLTRLEKRSKYEQKLGSRILYEFFTTESLILAQDER